MNIKSEPPPTHHIKSWPYNVKILWDDLCFDFSLYKYNWFNCKESILAVLLIRSVLHITFLMICVHKGLPGPPGPPCSACCSSDVKNKITEGSIRQIHAWRGRNNATMNQWTKDRKHDMKTEWLLKNNSVGWHEECSVAFVHCIFDFSSS